MKTYHYIKHLSQAAKGTTKELDGVIKALGGKVSSKTIVTYNDGSVVEYDIKGTLGQNSIPSIANAVKIEIGDDVTSIGEQALVSCSELTTVTIPDSVTCIGDTAINCPKLASITIPTSVSSLGNSSFSGCSSISTIVIPDSVTSIGEYSFAGCSSLVSVTLSRYISSIPNYAFADCTSLTGIWNPQDNIVSIGNYAFYNCSSLTTGASYLSSFSIRDDVTAIGDSAFAECTSIIEIDMPLNICNIGYYAFYNTNPSVTHMANIEMNYVQNMPNYPWGLPTGSYIDCYDGTLVVQSGGSGISS